MTGERLSWFRLAFHMRTPVHILQQQISSTEFVEWLHFLDLEVNGFHREDHYLAQIAAEIRRGNVMKPAAVKVEDFVLSFEKRKPERKKVKTAEEIEAGIRQIKSAWKRAVGLKG